MKHPFFKSILVLGAALALINCSDENSAAPSNDDYVTPDYCWVLNADQTMLIYANGIVTDSKGNTLGILNDNKNAIISLDGTQFIVDNVNLGNLTILEPGSTVPESSVILPVSSSSVSALTPASSAAANPFSSATVQPPKSSAGTTIKSSNSQQTQPKSSANVQSTMSSAQQPASSAQQQGGTCFDKNSNKNVAPFTEQVGKNGEKYAYKNDCTIECWWDGSNANCANIFGGSGNNNQQTQPKSSSSAKSSSSQQQQQQKSSSSQQQQSGATPTFTPVSGGKNKADGWASRYWDGCKPSCGWKNNSPTRTAHSCDKSGTNRFSGYDDKNIKDGGNAGTCLDQSPRVINGVAYAYAASHSNGDCGKCFLLEFTGTSHDKPDPTALAGKKMVVMISNIGGDVGGTQFDIMIPGGGIGLYDCIDGSNPISAVKNTERYGGIIATCGGAKEGANIAQVKSCVEGYCNKISNADAKAGCMFMVEWYEVANNPNFKATEVQCPTELTSRF
ncbi:MAG: hypothetical protein MJY85_06290 [Fibrobacter sp.]|nr:hypothetical protein [Fibrobacter sp.]